jgi:hypothetical protein
VIEAVALLRDEIPELRLEIYGDGSDLPRLRQVAAERQVAGPFQRRVRTDRGTRRGESRGPTSEWWPCGATPSATSPFPARCSTSSPWASRCCHPAPARLSRRFPRLSRAVRVEQRSRPRTGPASAARRPAPPGATRHPGGRRRRSVSLDAPAGPLPEHRGGPARRGRSGSQRVPSVPSPADDGKPYRGRSEALGTPISLC